MHPPQPPGGQQFAQPAPGQQPHGGQAWPAGTEQTGSSGITSWVAALLGCFVALGTQVGMLVILLNRASTDLRDVLAAVGSIAVLSVPPLVGASGVLARKRFGRWLLIGGLVLPVVLYGWITYVDPLLWPLCFFVGSLAAIALALSPTTGNYLREGTFRTRPRRPRRTSPSSPLTRWDSSPSVTTRDFRAGTDTRSGIRSGTPGEAVTRRGSGRTSTERAFRSSRRRTRRSPDAHPARGERSGPQSRVRAGEWRTVESPT